MSIGDIFPFNCIKIYEVYENSILQKYNSMNIQSTKIWFYEYSIYENVGDETSILWKWNSMKFQGDEISGYETSMGRKFRHENTIYVNEIYEYSIDRLYVIRQPHSLGSLFQAKVGR